LVKFVTKRGKKYWPTKEMKSMAWVSSKKVYDQDPLKFWAEQAKNLEWIKPWKTVYKEKLPYFNWFVGGKLNASVNCADRHLKNKADKTAIVWVPEPANQKKEEISYKELHEKVSKFANLLKKLKVKKGDVVTIYLPMIPEVIFAMLACARIGAIHSIVFSAFSEEALKSRIEDGKSKVLITADGYYRKGKETNLIDKVKFAIKGTKIKNVVVVPRLKKRVPSEFVNYKKEIKKESSDCKPEIMNSEDPLFILYTSGTTGKPKGVIHDTGGYLTQAYTTSKFNFNLHDNDLMWCTADVGWITGHTYSCYGPLSLGNTLLIYEGSPDYPNFGRWWKIIQDNKVNVFYTAPTAIRLFMKFGGKHIKKYNLNSLEILGSVGEPIDEDAWNWYFKNIGKSRLPIIDTWWQTETGANVINALPGVGPFIPSYAGRPFPGIRMSIVNDKGNKVKIGKTGHLVQLSPFAPGMLRGVFRNKKRYKETYWSKFKDKYDTSDGAFMDKEGNIRLVGRVDDVIKVAGHRLSTAEMENVLDEDKYVNESAVVPVKDKIRGEVPVAFVVLESGMPGEELKKKLIQDVRKMIGPIASIKEIYFVDDLPKTRSGKIMRRILKGLLAGEDIINTTTLVNPESVKKIKEKL
jgi:acetyl-CoA synthetase